MVTGQEKLPITFVTQTFKRQLEEATATSIVGDSQVIFTAKMRVRMDDGKEGKVWHRFYGPVTSHEQGEVTQDGIQQNTFTIDDTPLYVKSVLLPAGGPTAPRTVSGSPDVETISADNTTMVYGIDKRLDKFFVGRVDRLATLKDTPRTSRRD